MEQHSHILELFFQKAKETNNLEARVLAAFALYAKDFRFRRKGNSNLVASIGAKDMDFFGRFVGLMDDETGRAYQVEKLATIFLLNGKTPLLEVVNGDASEHNDVVASYSLGEFIGNACFRFHETLNLRGINFYVKENEPSVVCAYVETLNDENVAMFELVFEKDVV